MFLVSYIAEDGEEVLIGAASDEDEISRLVERHIKALEPISEAAMGRLSADSLLALKAELEVTPDNVERLQIMDRRLGTKFYQLVSTIKMVRA